MAVPTGLAASYAALAQQGAAYDKPDSPTDRYYAFLAEIEVIAPAKSTPLLWSAQFELVPFEWMEAAVLSQPDTVRTPPPIPPLSLLVFDDAAPDDVAAALGTTPDDIAETDWFVVTLGKGGGTASRVIPPAMTTILRPRVSGFKLRRGFALTRLTNRYTPRSKFSAKAIAAILAAFVPREIGVMDVGQGSCNLVYDAAGASLFYVDLGLPMFMNFASLPPLNPAGTVGIIAPGPCLQNNPPVFLTHFHWDHYWMANFSANWAALRNRDWVVPPQPGPGALALIANINAQPNGHAHVFPVALPHIAGGPVTVIQCVPGPGILAADINNSGLTVVVRINDGMQHHALLPGDSAFQSIPGLAGVAGLKWMPATHHGSDTNLIPPGVPSPIPAPFAANQGRLAYSYGINGAAGVGAHCYGHPAANAVAAYPPAGWGNGLLVESTAETGPNSGVAGRGNILMGSNVVPPPCPTPNCPFHVFPKTLV